MSHRSSAAASTHRGGGSKAPSHKKRNHPSSIHCNSCIKPLVTTCFLCACDCIFCEECTYKHFEHNSDCPSCGKVLTEQDFMEVTVADPSASNTLEDAKRLTVQTLFTRRSNQYSELPYTDLCSGVCRQMDTLKMANTFLLKQLLKDSKMQGQKFLRAQRQMEEYQAEITQLKQKAKSEQVRSEQALTELQNKLQAREQELSRYQQQYGGSISSGAPSSSRHHHGGEPPLRRGMMQKRAQEQQGYSSSHRGGGGGVPPMRHAAASSRAASAPGYGPRGTVRGGGGGRISGHPYQPNVTPMQQQQHQAPPDRPFSSTTMSVGSATPSLGRPIRDLSAGYKFTSHHINKRRRTTGSSSSSRHHGGASTSFSGALSPSSAFLGRHHGGGPTSSSSSFHRR